MKIKQLINELNKYPDNLDVIIWGNELQDNYNINYLEVDQINKKELIINVQL